MKTKDIKIYPTLQIIKGNISHEEYVNKLVWDLINEYYYGRRFDVKNLERLFKYTIQKLKKEIKRR